MASQNPRISLEQWLAFKTVVDTGSYARAAEQLHRSQSSVSYLISRLNAQLPGPVLALQGRKAVLTPEGEVLYRYAEQLVETALRAEAVAASMQQDFEAEVVIALDVLLQIHALCCTLETFSSRFPYTRVRVLETSLSGTVEALLEKQADIVIGGSVPAGYRGRALRTVYMIPVAAPEHPLVQGGGARAEFALRSHRQIVLRDTGQRRQQDSGWLEAEQRWTVSHFSSSISLVKAGLGFAFLPRNWIQAELKDGTLAEIPLLGGFERKLPLYLMLADSETAGPGTRALADLLVQDLQ